VRPSEAQVPNAKPGAKATCKCARQLASMQGILEPSVQAKSPSQVSKSSLQVKSASQVCKSRRIIALHGDLQACKPSVQACKSSLQVKSSSQVCKSSLPNAQVPAKCQVDLQVCKAPCKYARHLASEPK